MEKQKNTVLIAKTDKLIAETFANLLQANGYQTWLCHTEQEIAPLLQLHQPAVAFIGRNISLSGNVALVAALKSTYPCVQFVLFTQSVSLDDAAEALSMGIDGYLLYEDSLNDLLDCLECVLRGSPYLSPSIKRRLLAQAAEVEAEPHLISKRETEILDLIAQNRTNKEIADMLCISINTVQDHRKNIRRKLGMKGGKTILAKYLQSTPRIPIKLIDYQMVKSKKPK
ncbi:MAG: DNA-binding response regulator [Runella slithyformis]|nr:MAG: DNA-binding response regulator [Runella slithyformis]